MASVDKEKVKTLIRERAQRLTVYKRLDPTRKELFEGAVEAYATTVLDGASTREIKFKWTSIIKSSGAENLLEEMQGDLEASLGARPGALNTAIRNTARDTLLVIASPSVFQSIKDLVLIRGRSSTTNKSQIVPGRRFRTTETQPPKTGERTLRRKK